MAILLLSFLLLGLALSFALPVVYFAIILFGASIFGAVMLSMLNYPTHSLLDVLFGFVVSQIGYAVGLGIQGLFKRYRAAGADKRGRDNIVERLAHRAFRE